MQYIERKRREMQRADNNVVARLRDVQDRNSIVLSGNQTTTKIMRCHRLRRYHIWRESKEKI